MELRAEGGAARRGARKWDSGPRDSSPEPLLTFVGLDVLIWKMRPSNCSHSSPAHVDTSAMKTPQPFLCLLGASVVIEL